VSTPPLQTISETLRHEGPRVKGSRFIVDIAPATTEAEAKQLVKTVAEHFPDASHHCTAWRIAQPMIDRANDDGEPGGSAGRPILAQLTGRNLVDVAVVVTRYFGGTKLGVGGLVRAYGGSAGTALDQLTMTPWLAMTEVSLVHAYSLTERVEQILSQFDAAMVDRSFTDLVRVSVRIPESRVTDLERVLAEVSAGAICVESDSDLPQ